MLKINENNEIYISFKDVINKYNQCYNCNVRKFNFSDESELEEIIQEIFDIDNTLEVDYENNQVIIF